MLLAYYAFAQNSDQVSELCLIPDKMDRMNGPVKIDALEESFAAVQHIGPAEAVCVTSIPEENARLIKVLKPSIIYITPHTSEWPGEKATELKIYFLGIREYQIFYRRDADSEWMAWEPQKKVR
ncbi:MAG: hypothetical protein PHC51_03430 [bacterium]|nr:hypothetical protein [bacterium]